MKNLRHFPVVILEDSAFYAMLLFRQLFAYSRALSDDLGCSIDIRTFNSPMDFLDHLEADTALAYVDFYLDEETKATDIIRKIKRRCKNCKIVVMSSTRSELNMIRAFAEGATEFVLKDDATLRRASLILEQVVKGGVAGMRAMAGGH